MRITIQVPIYAFWYINVSDFNLACIGEREADKFEAMWLPQYDYDDDDLSADGKQMAVFEEVDNDSIGDNMQLGDDDNSSIVSDYHYEDTSNVNKKNMQKSSTFNMWSSWGAVRNVDLKISEDEMVEMKSVGGRGTEDDEYDDRSAQLDEIVKRDTVEYIKEYHGSLLDSNGDMDNDDLPVVKWHSNDNFDDISINEDTKAHYNDENNEFTDLYEDAVSEHKDQSSKSMHQSFYMVPDHNSENDTTFKTPISPRITEKFQVNTEEYLVETKDLDLAWEQQSGDSDVDERATWYPNQSDKPSEEFKPKVCCIVCM